MACLADGDAFWKAEEPLVDEDSPQEPEVTITMEEVRVWLLVHNTGMLTLPFQEPPRSSPPPTLDTPLANDEVRLGSSGYEARTDRLTMVI